MKLWRRDVFGLGLLAAASGPLAAGAQPKNAGMPEAQDAWLDEGGKRHRIVFDTTSAGGLGSGLNFARNFYTANQDGYGITAKELGVVIIVRHSSTPFGFNDAMWAKYGDVIAERTKFYDPHTKSAPRINLFNTAIKDDALPNGGVLVNDLGGLGARFAVCGMAVAKIAELAAKKSGGNANEIVSEITTNLVSNAVMTPAGIIALNRAQEHGYTFSYCG